MSGSGLHRLILSHAVHGFILESGLVHLSIVHTPTFSNDLLLFERGNRLPVRAGLIGVAGGGSCVCSTCVFAWRISSTGLVGDVLLLDSLKEILVVILLLNCTHCY